MSMSVRRLPSHRTRSIEAKHAALQAINDAAIVKSKAEPSRSSATRAAYKLKADALDRVARILTGKE